MGARLWRDWCRPHLFLILVNFGLILIFASVNGLYAPLIKYIVDGVQSGSDGLEWILIAAFGVTFLKSLALLFHKRLNVRIFSAIALSMQKALYRKMIGADIAWHGQEAAAGRAQRVTSDVSAVQSAMERMVNNLVRDVLMVVAVIASMIYIDWQLALIALLIFPIAILPIANIARTLRKISRLTQAQIASLSARLVEGLGAVRLAKTYQLEDRLETRSATDLGELRRLKVRAGDHMALIDPMLEMLGGIALVTVVFFVSWRIDEGRNTLGDFAGFITALLIAGQPMRALGKLIGYIQKGLAAAERVFAILDEKPQVIDAPDAAPIAISNAAITFETVGFRYADGTQALRDLTLTVEGGERIALVGRSGAGKSTLFNLLPRLFDPTEGRILIDGADIRRATLESLRAQIALVSQDAVMFDDTVAMNIAIGRDGPAPPDRERVIAAARSAAADGFIDALPNGFETIVGDAGTRLSGGQRQRLSIARAFYRDAPILLLDEATSALDAEAEKQVKAALDRLSAGRTSIVIAHRLSTIMDADRIAVLDDGRLVELGPHETLIAKGGLYAMLFEMQFEDVLA
ncbi:MAG: ATP-binding cassette domain-containing protein [Pseudomonadota bacterium]